jgi:hypothetical protein
LLSHKNPIFIPHFIYWCYAPSPSLPPWLQLSNYTRRRVQVMKLLIMQFPASVQMSSSGPCSATPS